MTSRPPRHWLRLELAAALAAASVAAFAWYGGDQPEDHILYAGHAGNFARREAMPSSAEVATRRPAPTNVAGHSSTAKRESEPSQEDLVPGETAPAAPLIAGLVKCLNDKSPPPGLIWYDPWTGAAMMTTCSTVMADARP